MTKENLSECEMHDVLKGEPTGIYRKEHVKEKIQTAQRRLKEIDMSEFLTEDGMFLDGMFHEEIDKIFQEEFGDKFAHKT